MIVFAFAGFFASKTSKVIECPKLKFKYATSNPLKLPRLPVPKIEGTLERFARSMEPHAESKFQLMEIKTLTQLFLEQDAKSIAAKVQYIS